jgi:hypothetical protein
LQGVVVTDQLRASDCWGREDGSDGSKRRKTSLALSVRRLVLAVRCDREGLASSSSVNATPAFIVDYAVESVGAQLGI